MSVLPFHRNEQLGVTLEQIQYPMDRLQRELTSGLPVHININVRLLKEQEELSTFNLIFRIRYDLWDEIFYSERVSHRGSERREYRDMEKLITDLSSLEITDVTEISVLDNTSSYRIQATVILSPVSRERVEKIRKWVADHGTVIIKNTNPNLDQPYSSTGPRFKKLFDMIFEQYTNADKEIGFWKVKTFSGSFQRKDLVPNGKNKEKAD